MIKDTKDLRRKGRVYQTGVYLGKFFRMFVFQSDWKVMPMSAVIAGLVGLVMSGTLFKTMEGTLTGSFALSCICVWNGFFNSIQNVCRERAIVKREHRSGVHISSYITAHTIYQAFLCLLQTLITMFVLSKMGVAFPADKGGIILPNFYLDMGITIFLTTFAADMLSLLVSSFVRNTTTAMTVMPFLLIFQLVFSGGFFSLPDSVLGLTNLTITKWSLTATCAQGRYNELPMTSLWVSLKKMGNAEVTGEQMKEFIMTSPDVVENPEVAVAILTIPDDAVFNLGDMLKVIEANNGAYAIEMKSGELNYTAKYASDPAIVKNSWSMLGFEILAYIAIATGALEFIDKDKR